MKTFKQFMCEQMETISALALIDQIEHQIRAFKELHWNAKGENFLPIHELLGDVYECLGGFQDKLAEKIRGTGSKVLMTHDGVEPEFEFDIEAVVESALVLLEELKTAALDVESNSSDPVIKNIMADFLEALDGFIYKFQSSIEKEESGEE